MPLIVDGYNVLFAIAQYGGRPVAEAIEEARTRLTGLLLRYHRHTGEAITLVYDSRQPAGGASRQESLPGVRIVYSHPPRTADDDIRSLVEKSPAPRLLRVVTSDRELARACTRGGAAVVGAGTFFRELTDQAREGQRAEEELRLKTLPPSREEIQDWLRIFGDDEGPDEPAS